MVNKSKRLYVILMLLFLYAPIMVLMVYSFNDSRMMGAWSGFTLKWYKELFYEQEVLIALQNTIVIAVISTLISTIIGVFAAYGIYNMKKRQKKLALNLNYLPVMNPDIVTAVSLMTLFRFLRIEFGLFTMLLSHIVFSIPYVILSVLPKLKQMNVHLAEAAMDLGARPFYVFKKVVIPQIMPGIITGALIAFTMSIDDFVISFFNTGHGVANLSIVIYSMARRGINPVINALSTLMFIGILILLIIINKRSDENIKNGGRI